MRQLQKYRNNLNTPSQPRLPVKTPGLRRIGTVYCHTNPSDVVLNSSSSLKLKHFQREPEWSSVSPGPLGARVGMEPGGLAA